MVKNISAVHEDLHKPTFVYQQVNVSRGANLPRILMEAAKGAGLPYYKLTFLSLATASQQVSDFDMNMF